jgi:hypothetical protein
MIFSTPVTPTRERLAGVEGARACTSAPTSATGLSLMGRIREDEDSAGQLYCPGLSGKCEGFGGTTRPAW